MNYLPYANETAVFPLTPTVTLERAPEDAFLNHWVAYRRVNEDFSQGFEQQVAELRGAPCFFWLKKGARLLGGLLMMPNNIGDMFLVPPFADWDSVLSWVLPQLQAWSNPERAIIAQAILPHQRDAFYHAGFRHLESRRWMIRPTATEPFAKNEAYTWQTPTFADKERIAQLFLDAFWGTIGERGQRSLSDHLHSVENYFSSTFPSPHFSEASSLLFETGNERVAIAACLVGTYKNLPSINFVATHPDHQKQGLATTMMSRAISLLHAHEYPWVILRVTVGNPAEALYQRLGFAGETAVSTLCLNLGD